MRRNSQRSNRICNWQELKSAADVWLLRTSDISIGSLDEICLPWLSTEERAHCASFRTERARRDYLATRALCRITLSRYVNMEPSSWSFRTGPNGKPEVIGPAEFAPLRFNLARTSGLVVCAVSRAGEVGVDAEETSRIVDVAQMARHFLSRREQTIIEQLSEHQRLERFFEQWVVREAYLKGSGTGIARAPERFTIEFDENGRPLPVDAWHFYVYRPSPTHVAALAVCHPHHSTRIRVEWLKADDLFTVADQTNDGRIAGPDLT